MLSAGRSQRSTDADESLLLVAAQARDALECCSTPQALSHASAALEAASRAYFDPSMLSLLYFPDEHKYAVYTPLFGPVAVPLVVSVIKLFKERRRRRQQADKASKSR